MATIRYPFFLISCVLFLLVGHIHAEVPERCEKSLVASASQTFIGYLGYLLETRVLLEPEIQTVLVELESSGRLVNPISEEAAQLDYDQYIHRGGMQKLIDADGIDREVLKQWLRRTLEERGVARVEREETRVETEDLHWKMIFHRIEPGEFEMGEEGAKVHVELTKPFDMMSTHVTQKMWAQVMKENPSKFVDGPNTIIIEIDGKPIKMQPDNPVEQANWDEAQRFIAKINELAAKSDELIRKLIPDHRAGDVYRLPTEAEWEFVVRAGGAANGRYHFGDDEAQLGDYAWYANNSDMTTHPVAEKRPLIIDGKEFYDLHGNVWEWVSDWYGNLGPGNALVDPQGPSVGSARVIRGGGWGNRALILRSVARGGGGPSYRSYDVGFRFARTRSYP